MYLCVICLFSPSLFQYYHHEDRDIFDYPSTLGTLKMTDSYDALGYICQMKG